MTPEGYVLRRFNVHFWGKSRKQYAFVFGLFTDNRTPVRLKIATETN
jgi:hypothetical protein